MTTEKTETPANALQPGARAPEVSLPDLEGRTRRPLSSDPGRHGPALLVFVKDTCPTCRYLLPFLDRIHAGLAGRGVRMYAVAQDDRDRSVAFARETGIGFPVLLDVPGYGVSRRFGLTAVPTSFLVGEDGLIRRTVVGFQKGEVEALARELAEGVGAGVPRVWLDGEEVPELKPG